MTSSMVYGGPIIKWWSKLGELKKKDDYDYYKTVIQFIT